MPLQGTELVEFKLFGDKAKAVSVGQRFYIAKICSVEGRDVAVIKSMKATSTLKVTQLPQEKWEKDLDIKRFIAEEVEHPFLCPKCGSKLLVEGGICIGGCKD